MIKLIDNTARLNFSIERPKPIADTAMSPPHIVPILPAPWRRLIKLRPYSFCILMACTLMQVSPQESKIPNRKSNNTMAYHDDENETIDVLIIKHRKLMLVAQYNPIKLINLLESNPKVIDPAGIADTITPTI